jgi:DTW domain-containing protein YfiP
LPAEPAQTRGALIVLTHPNERKRALATGWILPECFRRCAVVTKREPPRELTKMFADEDETSDEGVASDDSSANIRVSSPSPSDSEGPVVPNDVPVYVLYPASIAQDLDEVDPVADREALRSEAERSKKKKRSIRLSPPRHEGTFAARKTPPSRAAFRELANARDALRGAAYVLIALDSTWRQAREMAAAAMPALPRKTKLVKLPATKVDAPGLRSSVFRVHDDDEEKQSPSTVLRVEPELGCMLTAEACARAVEKLERRFEKLASGTPHGDSSSSEPPPSPASAAVATIRAMARVQSAHDPAMRAGATKADAAGKRRQRIAAARNLVVSGGT